MEKNVKDFIQNVNDGFEMEMECEYDADDESDGEEVSTPLNSSESEEEEDWSDDELFTSTPPASPVRMQGESPIRNRLFTINNSTSEDKDISDYSNRTDPTSPSFIGNYINWSSEGNPFDSTQALFVPMFEDLDVEGLIRNPGFVFEDNDLLRFPDAETGRTSLWKLESHPPMGNKCGCQWCVSYRDGGHWETHDPCKWCFCVKCLLFRKVEEAKLEHQALEVGENRCVDLMDYVPDTDTDESSRNRDVFCKTVRERLRMRSP